MDMWAVDRDKEKGFLSRPLLKSIGMDQNKAFGKAMQNGGNVYVAKAFYDATYSERKCIRLAIMSHGVWFDEVEENPRNGLNADAASLRKTTQVRLMKRSIKQWL